MITIRRARPGDENAIAGIYVETWRTQYAGTLPDRLLLEMSRAQQAAMWREVLERRESRETVLVAEDARAGLVGFGSCGRARGGALAFVGEVYTLYVLPDHQGRGLGRALLEALFESLVRGGLRSALIWVLSDNPSRFFYQAMGGAHVAVREAKMAGVALREMAYGWDDLEQATAPSDPPSAR